MNDADAFVCISPQNIVGHSVMPLVEGESSLPSLDAWRSSGKRSVRDCAAGRGGRNAWPPWRSGSSCLSAAAGPPHRPAPPPPPPPPPPPAALVPPVPACRDGGGSGRGKQGHGPYQPQADRRAERRRRGERSRPPGPAGFRSHLHHCLPPPSAVWVDGAGRGTGRRAGQERLDQTAAVAATLQPPVHQATGVKKGACSCVGMPRVAGAGPHHAPCLLPHIFLCADKGVTMHPIMGALRCSYGGPWEVGGRAGA